MMSRLLFPSAVRRVDVGDGGFVESHADDDGSVDGCVQLAVSTVVDSVLAGGHP